MSPRLRPPWPRRPRRSSPDPADSSPSIATDAHRVTAVPVPAYIDLMSVSPKVFLCPHTKARVAGCVPVPFYVVLMPVFQRLFLCPSLVIIVVFGLIVTLMTTSLAGNVTRKLASLESMSGHYGLLYAMFVLTDGHLSPPLSRFSICLSNGWG